MVLPARADAQVASPIVLYADGGTLGGSPGRGVYYSVGSNRGIDLRESDTSGKLRHSDEAEYKALIAALRILGRTCRPGDRALVVMDCRNVLERVAQHRTPRRPRCRTLFWKAVALKQRLESRGVELHLEWRERRQLVEVLGH